MGRGSWRVAVLLPQRSINTSTGRDVDVDADADVDAKASAEARGLITNSALALVFPMS